jgi:hypothetical protein
MTYLRSDSSELVWEQCGHVRSSTGRLYMQAGLICQNNEFIATLTRDDSAGIMRTANHFDGLLIQTP